METNIFENVKFGDKFITNNGEIGLFICQSTTNDYPYVKVGIIYTHYDGLQSFDLEGKWVNEDDGTCYSTDTDNRHDIKGRYIEPINEETLREKAYEWTSFVKEDNLLIKTIALECAMIGYRKAKENE